jgi:hypothetical protein
MHLAFAAPRTNDEEVAIKSAIARGLLKSAPLLGSFRWPTYIMTQRYNVAMKIHPSSSNMENQPDKPSEYQAFQALLRKVVKQEPKPSSAPSRAGKD